jgi:hypothetical protein
MEDVKHHVDRSGNSSLRGFFSSDSVDFDPPSLSLRQNITKAKAKVVYDLASGFTPASEERAIRDLMKASENSYELIRMPGPEPSWSRNWMRSSRNSGAAIAGRVCYTTASSGAALGHLGAAHKCGSGAKTARSREEFRGAAADQVCAGDQPEDREGSGPYGSAIAPRPRRQGDARRGLLLLLGGAMTAGRALYAQPGARPDRAIQ